MPMPLLVRILALLGVLLVAGCAPPGGGPADRPPVAGPEDYTDKQLYRDVATQVAAGRSYYAAAAELQREHGYPLRPALTVRPPTLAVAAARLGWTRLRILAVVLLGLSAGLWFAALRRRCHWVEACAASALVGAGAAMFGGSPVILHERWAGLLIGLALVLRVGWRRAWPLSLAAAALALAVRELTLPFVVLALASAMAERRRGEAAAWALLLVAFAALMAAHLALVAEHVRSGDLVSPGWSLRFDPAGAVRALVHTSPLQYLPPLLAVPLALVPLFGWAALGGGAGRFCLVLFGGYFLMITLFARPDNFYWGALVQPAWFAGLAFVPRGALRLWRGVLDRRRAAPNLAGAGARL